MRRPDSSEEYRSPSEEIASPAPENMYPSGSEFTKAPDEYVYGAVSPPEEDRGRRRLLKHFMAIPALVLALGMFLSPVSGAPAAEPEPGPEPVPVTETYPLGDGEIQITVYNDTIIYLFPGDYTYDEDEIITVLDRVTIAESEFEEYVLPAPRVPTSFVFRGWSVHCGNPFDQGPEGASSGEPAPGSLASGDQRVFVIGDVLTREDVERIPVSADGVRYVNIHAMWILEDPENTKNRIIFHDGDEEWIYGAETPAASEGFTYLAAFPTPEKEGYVFDGWYDEDGNRVEILDYYVYFDAAQNPDGSWDYDWDDPHPVHLYAGWKEI